MMKGWARMYSSTITIEDLAGQTGELLPPRETLFFDINVAPVTAINVAIAINAASFGSSATALAGQWVVVAQG